VLPLKDRIFFSRPGASDDLWIEIHSPSLTTLAG
jgi:hypothetical protein